MPGKDGTRTGPGLGALPAGMTLPPARCLHSTCSGRVGRVCLNCVCCSGLSSVSCYRN